jgi:DNA-binding response OmpR family regulator
MVKAKTICVVDDDPDILRVLAANLSLHGFAVMTAATAASCLELVRRQVPDLIILDVVLPDDDGFSVCRSLRSMHPTLPIIMLTARDKVSDKVIGLECGADDYVVKPFETLELIARIKVCLRRLAPSLTRIIHAGEVCIDLDRRQVQVQGEMVVLTSKEFDLLVLLAAKKGKVVSREEIRRHLWKDSDIYSWSRVIDVHIQHLRQKIEINPSTPQQILTVPGIGYRIAE